jgi:hypothetical protein
VMYKMMSKIRFSMAVSFGIIKFKQSASHVLQYDLKRGIYTKTSK